MTFQSRCAYMAGLMDGEGSFSIVKTSAKSKSKKPEKFGKRNIRYHLHIKIANTSLAMLEWVTANFGGQISIKKKWKANWKKRYDWVMTSNSKMEKFSLNVLPYLIVKAEQAKIAIEFCRLHGQVNPQERIRLRNIMLGLNDSCQPHSDSLETNTPNCPENGQMTESELRGDSQSDLTVT